MAWMKPGEALAKAFDLVVRGELKFTFDGMPMDVGKLSRAKRVNLVKCGIDLLLRSSRLMGLPPMIQVEPTNVCNLKCPLCPTGMGTLARKKGYLSRDTFARILSELEDVLLVVVLYGWGEPLLNKELPQIIGMCTERGIRTVTSTNGQCLQTMEEALAVVDAGLSAVVIAIDGSTQEIYRKYRKSGDVEKVKRCAANLEEAKARRGATHPVTNFRVVVTRDNQDDLGDIERLAREIGVDMFSCKTVGMLTEDEGFLEREGTQRGKRRFEHEGEARRRRPAIQCHFPFRQPTFFWDGTLVGCEYDLELEAPWGRIGERTFRRMWSGREALALRYAMRRGLRRPGFCDKCPYRDQKRTGTVLSCKHLRGAGAGAG